MKKTYVEHWNIVKLIDFSTTNDNSHQEILWAVITKDETGKFDPFTFICSKTIMKINTENKEVITIDGDIFILTGDGQKIIMSVDDLNLLEKGYSPTLINLL